MKYALILIAIAISACGASATDGQTVCSSLHAVASAAEVAADMCDQWATEGRSAETCPGAER